MNTNYLSHIKNIDNKKLALAGQELLDFKNTGILVDGEIRNIARMVSETVGDTTYSLTVAENCVLKEIAIRFIGEHSK